MRQIKIANIILSILIIFVALAPVLASTHISEVSGSLEKIEVWTYKPPPKDNDSATLGVVVSSPRTIKYEVAVAYTITVQDFIGQSPEAWKYCFAHARVWVEVNGVEVWSDEVETTDSILVDEHYMYTKVLRGSVNASQLTVTVAEKAWFEYAGFGASGYAEAYVYDYYVKIEYPDVVEVEVIDSKGRRLAGAPSL